MRKSTLLKVAFTCFALALVLAWAFFVNAGCTRQEATLTTGKVIPGVMFPGVRGDSAYAEVRADALPALYARYRSTLSNLGLPSGKWDRKQDCNHLCDAYVVSAQVSYTVAAWHSGTTAQSLALAVVWYRTDAGGSHAVVEARTDRGTLFIDPQRGASPVTLTPNEQANVFFRKW